MLQVDEGMAGPIKYRIDTLGQRVQLIKAGLSINISFSHFLPIDNNRVFLLLL